MFIIPAISYFFYRFEKVLKVKIWIILIIFLTLIANLQLIKQITKFGAFHHFYNAAKDIELVIEKEPSDMILVTGCNSVFYNETNTLPHIRYFITYGAGLSYENFPDATIQQMNSILSGENDYIIIATFSDDSVYGIENIDKTIINYLGHNYNVVYKYNNEIIVKLYKKKVELLCNEYIPEFPVSSEEKNYI